MVRTKPSLFYTLSGCSLAVALALWLAIETLPRWTTAYHLTAVSSAARKDNVIIAAASDDVMKEVFANAAAKTGVEAFLRP